MPESDFAIAAPSVGDPSVQAQWQQEIDQAEKEAWSRSWPRNRLIIPSLKISAPLAYVSAPGGDMTIPPASQVGILRNGPGLLDDMGTVIMAGHVTSRGSRGALYALGSAKPQALVIITDPQGRPTYWAVTSIKAISKRSLSVQVRGSENPLPLDGPHQVAIITCGGRVVGGSYVNNVVLMASPIPDPEL